MATTPLLGAQQGAAGYGDAGNYGSPVDTPSFQGETPDEDEAENPNAQPPAPTAPSLDNLEVVSGYEGVGFNAGQLTPPSYNYAETVEQQRPEAQQTNVPRVTEDQARQALLEHVSQNCCYGKAAAQELVFTSIDLSNAFHVGPSYRQTKHHNIQTLLYMWACIIRLCHKEHMQLKTDSQLDKQAHVQYIDIQGQLQVDRHTNRVL
jgi:hypothetical protein